MSDLRVWMPDHGDPFRPVPDETDIVAEHGGHWVTFQHVPKQVVYVERGIDIVMGLLKKDILYEIVEETN